MTAEAARPIPATADSYDEGWADGYNRAVIVRLELLASRDPEGATMRTGDTCVDYDSRTALNERPNEVVASGNAPGFLSVSTPKEQP